VNTARLMEMFAPLVREWERKKVRSAAMTFTLIYYRYSMLHKIEILFDQAFHWFIIYLIIGEFLFLTVGVILPTFIF